MSNGIFSNGDATTITLMPMACLQVTLKSLLVLYYNSYYQHEIVCMVFLQFQLTPFGHTYSRHAEQEFSNIL